MINDLGHVQNGLSKVLVKEGFKLISLNDNGRTYLGRAKKVNETYYVKVAKSKEENLRLQNSVIFNQELGGLKPPFNLSNVVFTGTILKDFYFKVETELKGRPMAILKKSISELEAKKPENYFQQIIEMINWLQKQEIILLNSFDQQLGAFRRRDKQSVINTMISWSFNATPRLSDLLKIVRTNQSAFEGATAHRDITPINIIISLKDKVGLIDADIADTTAPKYYDVAEFYNRLWTRVCRPDLAKEFLKLVVGSLKENRDEFYHHLQAILALRAVGNYWETMQLKENQRKRIKFLTSFADHVADKQFLS